MTVRFPPFGNPWCRDQAKELSFGRSIIFAACKHFSVSTGGSTVTATVGAMSFPAVGTGSSAYSANLETKGITVGADFICFQASPSVVGLIVYYDVGQPDASSVQAYVNEAVNKAEGMPTTTPTTF
jgi:hypothetical protein